MVVVCKARSKRCTYIDKKREIIIIRHIREWLMREGKTRAEIDDDETTINQSSTQEKQAKKRKRECKDNLVIVIVIVVESSPLEKW